MNLAFIANPAKNREKTKIESGELLLKKAT
jgi:hypothetical protein